MRERRGETDKHNLAKLLGRTAWMLDYLVAGLYLCFVLGLGPGVGRGVLTWLMSSILARGARGALALTILSLLDMISDHSTAQHNFTTETSQLWTIPGLGCGGEISPVKSDSWWCGLCDLPGTTEQSSPSHCHTVHHHSTTLQS